MCDLDACEWLTIGLFGCCGVSKNIVIIIVIVFNKNFNLCKYTKEINGQNKIWKKCEFIKKLEIH